MPKNEDKQLIWWYLCIHMPSIRNKVVKLHSIVIVSKFYILTGSQPKTQLDTFICTEVDPDAGRNLEVRSGPPSACELGGSSHRHKRSMTLYV